MTNISIPEGVNSIGECAFSECSSLESISVPGCKIEKGNHLTFKGCSNLKELYIYAELDEINARKTGALLTAACTMGVAAAEGSRAQEEAAARFGAAVGMAFQIRDDMLDALSSEAELGKPIGSDAAEHKNTYMVLLGEEACGQLVDRLTDEACACLRGAFDDTGFLEALATKLAKRNH